MGAAFDSPAHQRQNIFTWSDDIFYTKGRQRAEVRRPY